MPRRSTALVFVLGLLTLSAKADERTTPDVWVAAFTKLGGNATFDKNERGLAITQFKDAKRVDFAALPEPAGVRTVVLHGGNVSDADVGRVAGWADVRTVELSDCFAVTDVGVRHLSANSKFTHVVLGDTAVTSAGVNSFSGHGAMERLELVNTNVTPSAVRSIDLDSMPALKFLQVSCPRLASLRLADCKSLEDVVGLPAEVETAVLTDLPKLAEFDAAGTKVSKLTISGKSGLTELNVRKTQLTERQVKHLKAALPDTTVKSEFTK